jgi:hypothetical protein
MSEIEMPQTEEQETTLSELSEEVSEAETALLEQLGKEEAAGVSPRRLQESVRNGWSAAVVSIAFWRLVNSGQIVVDEGLCVRIGSMDSPAHPVS